MSISSTRKMAVRAITLEEYRRTEAEREAPPAPARGSRLTELLEALNVAKAWRRDAACKGKPTRWWFPEHNERWTATAARARQICGACPVAEPCRAYALEHNLRGIWGQSMTVERTRERRVKTANGRPGTRELGPTALAILAVLDDGHWHDYDELFAAAVPSISIDNAARRWNNRRSAQGLQAVPVRNMTKAALGSGRRMIFVDTINTLARSGRVERGGGTLRLRREVAAG